MDAPMCRNFPSCGKRHYGACGGPVRPKADKPVRLKPKPGEVVYTDKFHEPDAIFDPMHEAALQENRIFDLEQRCSRSAVSEMHGQITHLYERVGKLEEIMDELLATKRNHTEYMRQWQQRRRAKEKKNG